MDILKNIDELLISWGTAPSLADMLDQFIAFALVLIVAFLADVLCRKTHLTFVGCVFCVCQKNLPNCEMPTEFVAIDKNAILLYNKTITFFLQLRS